MTEWTPGDIRAPRRVPTRSAGDTEAAIVEFRAAAARTTNLRQQHYLTRAAHLATELADDGRPRSTVPVDHRSLIAR